MRRIPVAGAMVAVAAAAAIAAIGLTGPAGASPQLSSVVSQTPVSWTPNISADPTVGTSACSSTYFGSGSLECKSEVYGTAYVHGDVVVVGAFTEACQPGKLSQNQCVPGTQVTRNDILAYSASTGAIDPNFAPVLNQGPAFSVIAGPPGSNAVYVGGEFTTVNGAAHKGLVELNVNPGVTSGTTADGSVVTSFKASVSKYVQDLALSPDGSALYVGGQFTSVDSTTTFSNGTTASGLARLNAKTGALDKSFGFTLGDPISGLPIKIDAMALSPDGSHLAFSGTALQVDGQSRPRMAIVDTGGTLGAPSGLADWTAPILANNCSAEHDYVRALDFSPAGTFVVTGDTGYLNDNSMPFSACDAVARFNVNAANTTTTGSPVDVAPSWINYAGGDSFYSVAVAGNVVYAGGHNRWINNYCGQDSICEPNALLANGISALDANTGMGLPWWHPLTLRGDGTGYLATFPAGTYDGSHAGLALGSDTDLIDGAYHSENALFPLAAATSPDSGGPIPSGMFNEEDGANTGTPMCLDDSGDSSASGTAAVLAICDNDGGQNWTVQPGGNIEVNGLCLDSVGGGTASGTLTAMNTCTGAATQKWTQGPGNTLVNQGASTADSTQMCLDDPGSSTTDNEQLDIAPCDGGPNQAWPLPAAQAPPAPPGTGPIWPSEQQSNSQVPCLDDTSNSTAAGNKVQLWTCRGDAEQQWTMKAGGTIQINGNYCLDSSNPAQTGSVPVVLNSCNGATSQQWTVEANGELENVGATTLNGTPYCLDDPGFATGDGTAMQLYSCNGGTNQTWWLPKV